MSERNKYCGRCGIPVHGQFCLDCRKADPIYFRLLKEGTHV
jgi:hypothetical protein